MCCKTYKDRLRVERTEKEKRKREEKREKEEEIDASEENIKGEDQICHQHSNYESIHSMNEMDDSILTSFINYPPFIYLMW